MQPTPQQLIAKLGLEPHHEGGWFRQAYKSATQVHAPQGLRAATTTIYYLLEHGRPCPWHVVKSDEIWHFYHGAPSELLAYDPTIRQLTRYPLCGVTEEGVQVAVIPAGAWQAAHCRGKYMLAGCTVCPGYEAQDFAWVRELPGHLQHFTGEMAGLQAFL